MINQALIGKKLRQLREVKDVTREAIAELLHIDVSTYGRYETGAAMPPTDHLRSLAEYHQISIDSLLSPDPMVFTIHNAHGTQVGNGTHAKFVQHVVSEEFVRKVFDRMDKHMTAQFALNQKLVELLDKFGEKRAR